MPKFCANLTLLFNEAPFLDRFERAAKQGFDGVEYLFPYAYPKAQLAEKLAAHELAADSAQPAGGRLGAGQPRHRLPARSRG